MVRFSRPFNFPGKLLKMDDNPAPVCEEFYLRIHMYALPSIVATFCVKSCG
jgi:hypothetical protein